MAKNEVTEKLEEPAEQGISAAVETLSQWQLIRRRFFKHKLAVASLLFLVILYMLATFTEFFSPQLTNTKHLGHTYCPAQMIHWGLTGPYVYNMKRHVNPITFQKGYQELRNHKIPLSFFVKGDPYKMWGLFPMKVRFLGIDYDQYHEMHPNASVLTDGEPTFFLLGSDKYGRDILSRVISGSRISLSVGLIGIVIGFVLGISIGGISGYIGGGVDNLIQRIIEILNAFPKMPLWLALGAVMPADWSPIKSYFAITVVLSLLGWTTLARVVRGKLLSLREEDYAMAARLLGASHARIIFRHLIPGFTSHIIVSLSLTIPSMILGETSLSFLGLGLRPPIVSWGVMLQDCMDMTVVQNYPWLLLPVLFIVLTVLCFNFMGDGLRDAADPYSSK